MSVFEILLAIAFLILAYLAGSIPVGYLIGRRVANKDVFAHGSGSMGMTNVIRVLGPRAGIFVFSSDLLKGAIPALVVGLAMPNHPEIQALAGVAAVAGHSWSMWVGFRGGKGLLTGLGAVIVIFPTVLIVAAPIGLALIVLVRYVSLGSIGATVIAFATGIVWYVSGLWTSVWGLVYVGLAGALILWQHRSNMLRLAHGTESRLAAWPIYRRSRGGESDESTGPRI